ncbi:hypothetical protein [Bifidobacterium simiarum]|uniref:hypothetical protein n=1 Tax=Bifidobacterium simiarum TaxID=2045441 RepID=UPI001BDDB5BB|nr:hypothetical protein [Bifidobacterium simiarum]MBT1165762.1 hypothetical protein [Bifidobacterium simiarum]
MEYALTALVGLFCAVIGVGFAAFPRRTWEMTERQRRISSMAGVIFMIMFVGFMLSGRDPESWAVLVGGIVGYGIGCIPALRDSLIARFDVFAPAKPQPAKPQPGRQKSGGRRNRTK